MGASVVPFLESAAQTPDSLLSVHAADLNPDRSTTSPVDERVRLGRMQSNHRGHTTSPGTLAPEPEDHVDDRKIGHFLLKGDPFGILGRVDIPDQSEYSYFNFCHDMLQQSLSFIRVQGNRE